MCYFDHIPCRTHIDKENEPHDFHTDTQTHTQTNPTPITNFESCIREPFLCIIK